MTLPQYCFTPEEIISLNCYLTNGSGILVNKNGLESALARPYQTYDGRLLLPELFAQGAVLLHSLCINHPFTDGNKRTALMACVQHLQLGGWQAPSKFTNNKGSESFIIGVAEGRVQEFEIIDWISCNWVYVG